MASPPWHRRLRQRRARARILVRVARGKPAPTKAQLDKVFSALSLLQGHHSAPRYWIPMSWNQGWNTWQKNQGKGGKSKSRGSKPAGGPNKDKVELPSYDSMPGSSQPSPPATSPVVGQAALIEILKKVAAKDEEVAKQVENLLPEEEDTSLKDQQKMLNTIRKLKTKISKKEQALVHKEDQMQSFIEKMRVHVQAEKERHKSEVDEINKELVDLRKDLERVKSGQVLEKEDMEISLLAALREGEIDLEEDNKRLQKELVQAQRAAEEASQMAYHMKAQFDDVMTRMAQFTPTGTSPPPSENLDGKKPVPVVDLEKKATGSLIKDPMAPFGVVKTSKGMREGPYSPGNGKEAKPDQRMDQMS